jgi:predicted nucleotidyltransferase component of viral defense system
MSDATTPTYHDDPSRLIDALRLAESVHGFSARLVEKDYYCSLLLQALEGLFREGLVFKGGTSLSKVHTEFFRLSEDLDFSIPVEPTAAPRLRRDAAAPFKRCFTDLPTRLRCFRIAENLRGHDTSRQYTGRLAYHSVVTDEDEFLRLEVGLREKVLLPVVDLPARTLLSNPATSAPVIAPFHVRVLSLREAYAEKVRAALTRREPAIRDFFDVDHAVQKQLLQHLDPDFLQLLKQKLATADPVDISATRTQRLKAQQEAELKSVLRAADFEAFSLDRAITLLEVIAAKC